MAKLWFVAAALALALAACDKADPLANARALCADGEAPADAQIAACTTAIESGELDDRTRAAMLASRGAAHAEAGDVTPALRDFEAAMSADDANLHAVLGRASILIDSGQIDAAQPLVERLLESGQFTDRAHYLMGNIAARQSDNAAAIEAYDRAIAANPRFALAFANRGAVRQIAGDHAAAIADYTSALDIDPNLAAARAGRCWSRVLSDGDLARARDDADAAVAADARFVAGQLCRGLLQLRAEEWEGARVSYEAALAVEPGNPYALFGRGVARRRAGDDLGRADMNQARDFNSHVAEDFSELGVRSY